MVGFLILAGTAWLGWLAWGIYGLLLLLAAVVAFVFVGWALGWGEESDLTGDGEAFSDKRQHEDNDTGLRHDEIIAGRERPHPAVLSRRPMRRLPTRNPWTHEQDLAVLYLQRLKNERQATPQAIRELAWAMNRTEAAIQMRIGNFDSLDSSVPSKGLSNAAQLTKDIWGEYQRDPKRISAEALRAYSNLVDRF